jgi:hypothetical protein
MCLTILTFKQQIWKKDYISINDNQCKKYVPSLYMGDQENKWGN